MFVLNNSRHAKYALKTPKALVLEKRQHGTNGGSTYMFEGHYGEHFVIRGLLSNGVSFEINHVI